MKTITQKLDPHAAACCSETKNRYICISEESEGSYPDTLFETLPRIEVEALDLTALIIVEHYVDLVAQQKLGLGWRRMPMNWKRDADLQNI